MKTASPYDSCFRSGKILSGRIRHQRQPALTDSRYLYTFSPRLGQIRRALRRAVRTKMEAYRRAFITTGSFEPVKHVMVRPSPLARSVDEYPDAHP